MKKRKTPLSQKQTGEDPRLHLLPPQSQRLCQVATGAQNRLQKSREEEKEEEEELDQYTNEDKKEDLHPPQKRQFDPGATDFDLEQKDQSEDESVWGDWGSGGRIQPEPEPKVARTPRSSGSRWWLSATGKDKRRSQSSRQFRILKGLLKLAQKKEEEPSAELQEEIESFGQAPWKRRRVQPKTPPKSPPKSSPAPKTPPKGFTKAQRKEPSPGAEPELLTPVAERVCCNWTG